MNKRKQIVMLLCLLIATPLMAECQWLRNIAASPSTTSAVITWTTCSPSTSAVRYGLTTSYGTTSLVNSTLVTSHSVTISGLTASTLYHYRVLSTDSTGVQIASKDHTFTAKAAVRSVAVTPASASVAVGSTKQFTATATYSDGTQKVVVATWSSSSTSVATISSGGLATGIAAGTATITATFSGKSGTAALTVVSLTAVNTTPQTATILVGGNQQFSASGVYSDGSTTDLTSLSAWSTSNSTVASVNATGLATGNSTGTANIAAAYRGVSGASSLQVNQALQHSANLTWNDPDPVTFNLLRGTTDGGPYSPIQTGITVLNAVDNNVQSGQTYYYVVTAQNSNGVSAYSNQATAIIP